MIERIVDRISLPLTWVGTILLVAVPFIVYIGTIEVRLENVTGRVDTLAVGGSTATQRALHDVEDLAARVTALETLVQQIGVNTNRLTKIETLFDGLRSADDALRTTTEHLDNRIRALELNRLDGIGRGIRPDGEPVPH